MNENPLLIFYLLWILADDAQPLSVFLILKVRAMVARTDASSIHQKAVTARFSVYHPVHRRPPVPLQFPSVGSRLRRRLVPSQNRSPPGGIAMGVGMHTISHVGFVLFGIVNRGHLWIVVRFMTNIPHFSEYPTWPQPSARNRCHHWNRSGIIIGAGVETQPGNSRFSTRRRLCIP